LHESIVLLETRSFVALSPTQVSRLLSGVDVDLDSGLAAAARDATAKAEKREAAARDPFFKDHAEMFWSEARAYRALAADALRLRGGRTAPYLVRALVLNEATGGFSLYLDGDDLCVFHGSLGHSPVPMTRHPVVVYLERPPKRVLVDVSMAE